MSRGKGSKLKLMVVDDEIDNLDLLYRTFRRDFEVYRADSAFTALETLEQQGEMAIIISDQRMPEMNGTEFLGKTVERFPDTVRILLTGYTDVEDLVEAINSGKVFKYITKPWNPEELKALVQQASETYQVVKQSTNTLRRALRRESLFNQVMIAIRESLDYRSMLQTIVERIGESFQATSCILRPVESDRLMPDAFSYQAPQAAATAYPLEDSLIQTVLQSRKTELVQSDANGNSTTRLVVPLAYQKELLAVLSVYQDGSGSNWSPEDIQLIEGVVDQAALALSQAKLYQRTQDQAQQMRAELEVARQIQTNLLRQSWPDLETAKVQASCFPAREVGGDFFEVYIHAQGDIWIAVGDVSGKGVPAALFVASAISVMRRELAQETSPEPDVVMQNLNSALADDLISNNCFITMVVARYTPSTYQMVYANAGHIYPLVWSHRDLAAKTADVQPNFLKARGVPLGILPVWKAKAGIVELKPGDVFLLTSDGITEVTITDQDPTGSGFNAGAMLQQEGLWQLLTAEPAPLDLTHLLTRVRDRAHEQEDDQTILSLEVL